MPGSASPGPVDSGPDPFARVPDDLLRAPWEGEAVDQDSDPSAVGHEPMGGEFATSGICPDGTVILYDRPTSDPHRRRVEVYLPRKDGDPAPNVDEARARAQAWNARVWGSPHAGTRRERRRAARQAGRAPVKRTAPRARAQRSAAARRADGPRSGADPGDDGPQDADPELAAPTPSRTGVGR